MEPENKATNPDAESNRLLIIAAVIFLGAFGSGYMTGKAYPSAAVAKQKALNERRHDQLQRLNACRAVMHDVRTAKGHDEIRLTSDAFFNEDLPRLQNMIHECENDLQVLRDDLSHCETAAHDAAVQRDHAEHVGGGTFTSNVEGIMTIALKNTTDQALKEISEHIRDGGKVKRDHVIERLLAQTRQTRKKLATHRATCHDTTEYDVTAELRKKAPFLFNNDDSQLPNF